ncbi:MAG: iron ABC transporter permease [Pseudomonadota bacterium]
MFARQLTLWLFAFFACTATASLAIGPTGTSLWGGLWKVVSGQDLDLMERVVLWDIRMPRMVLGAAIGAALAVSGAVMQGLFRNPLADPGLIGVSAGAGLGAITAIVLGGLLPLALQQMVGPYLVTAAAFLAGWASTILLYRVATRSGQTSIATMLLAGLALAALAGAASGVLIFMADDQQLRDLTFWGLGSLAGATWTKALVAVPFIGLACLASLSFGRGLNALALGEATASHLGVEVQRLKSRAILAVAAAVGAAVAVSGGIGFIGIIVPHLIRVASGPDHVRLLPNAALLGASLLLLADIISRMIVAPAELPIGIVTAILGSPVFLWILLRRRGFVSI